MRVSVTVKEIQYKIKDVFPMSLHRGINTMSCIDMKTHVRYIGLSACNFSLTVLLEQCIALHVQRKWVCS